MSESAQTSEANPTIFGKILRGEIPADIVYEDDQAVAFKDLNPAAPTHILVIPRKHIVNLIELDETEDPAILGHLLWVVSQVAKQEGLEEDGYRVVINNGRGAGQSVFHIHLHILSGRPLSWPPG